MILTWHESVTSSPELTVWLPMPVPVTWVRVNISTSTVDLSRINHVHDFMTIAR